MRRWGSIGLAGITVGLIGWAAAIRFVERDGSDGVTVERVKASVPSKLGTDPREHSDPRHDEIDGPSAVTDTRDARERIDNVLAELRLKHDELVDVGAAAAARTVHAQIQRLEGAQERAAVGE